MIDDSLSDTQQEKKQMSVEALDLKEGQQWLRIRHVQQGCFTLAIDDKDIKQIGLDRSQAHLLMLYLQEHLGYVSISKDRLND